MRRRVFLSGAAALVPGATLADAFGPVPQGTTLTIGDPLTQYALLFSGHQNALPFDVKWANISGGPSVNQAIRGDALDLGIGGNVPPIWAHWTGLDVKIVGVWGRQDPLKNPVYTLGLAPGVKLNSLSDLRGKRIAYAPGQAQGLLVLHALAAGKVPLSDVTLVQLTSIGNVYVNALASRQVDVAPLGEIFGQRYLASYGRDGASVFAHGLRDDLEVLYGPTSSTQNAAKADAIAAYVQVWAKSIAWVNANPQIWAQKYYVQNQGLSPADAQYLINEDGKWLVPASWDDAISQAQQAVELVAPVSNEKVFDASIVFDRRFEKIGADAFAAGWGS